MTAVGFSQAASQFAQAAAVYAQSFAKASSGMHSQPVDACDRPVQLGGKFQRSFVLPGEGPLLANNWTHFQSWQSCPSESSFDSEDSASDNCFLPMEEEEEEREVQPLPDQAWWEEFGEFESAPQPQVGVLSEAEYSRAHSCNARSCMSQKIILHDMILFPTCCESQAQLLCMQRSASSYTWPRLVIGNDIVRLPVTQILAPPATISQPDKPVCEQSQVGNPKIQQAAAVVS